MESLKANISRQTIDDIQAKLNNSKEKLKALNKKQEDKIVDGITDASIISVGAGFLGGFSTAVLAYQKNISYRGKRTEIIETFFQKYPEQIPLARKATGIRNYDAMVDFLNNEDIGHSAIYDRTGLADYFSGLGNLTIAETIVASLICASIPLVYYFANKHYNNRREQRIKNEIAKFEAQLEFSKKN